MAIAVFEALSLALACVATLGFARALARRGVKGAVASFIAGAFLALSWPLYFAMERGNVELLIWPILALGVVAYAHGRWTLAAVCIGIAGALKLYPLLCLALLVSPRRYRDIALGLVTALLMTLLALKQIGPDITTAAKSIESAITSWTRLYAVAYQPGSVSFDHTGYELLKFVTVPLHPSYPALERVYLPFAALVACMVFLLRIRHLSRTNQVVFLMSAMIFLPPASFDYTLLHLYVPFAWLALLSVEQTRKQRQPPALTAALLLCGLLVAPETFLLHDGLCYSSLFKGFLLLAMLVLVSCAPLQDLETPSGSSGIDSPTR